jgi:UDP-N-acetylmuramate-alanine ligase
MDMNYQGKKILVIGQARSGMAAIRLLRKLGADTITLTERKEVKNREELESYGVRIVPQEDALFEEDWDLVIKNPGVPPVSPFIQKMKARGIDIITEVELAFRNAKPQHYAAITGTNGKTTTTTLTYEILKTAYKDKAHVSGNIGTPLCETVLDYNLLEEEEYCDFLEENESALNERMRHMSDTFQEYLFYLIESKDLTNAQVYKRAIITKQLFSKIKLNPDYHPDKATAMRLCVGAELSLDETVDLLARAGYALSPCDKRDIIFSFFIENKVFDMIEIDIALEEHGLACFIQ